MTTASTPQPEASPEGGIVGTTISGRYRIERLLGEGGMGAVYQAEHTLMHKRVAVKVLHAEMSKMAEVVTRFEREAMAAAHIEHPNVASATDFGKLDDGSFFLVLEFIEGKSLREFIAKGRIGVLRVVHIARQIASALSRAHGLGIVHRDLKPENVMLVTRDMDLDFVKVLDFGIAKVPVGDIAPKSTAGEALTRLGMVYGTPEYMPPEQALGQEVDRRADLYALGVMMYEMLAGARPFDDESKVKLLGKHITAPVPPLPKDVEIAPELEALVMKLLAKDANDRLQEAKDVVDALDAMVTPPPPPPQGRASSGLLPVTSSGPIQAIPTSHPSLPSMPKLHPTVLALEAHAKTLASDVTRIVPPKILFPAIGLFAVATFVTIVALLVHAGSSSTSPSSSSPSPSSAALAEKPPHFDQELKAAQAELGSNNYDAAITKARALANEAPARPEPLHVIFQAHVGKGDTKSALADAGQWLSIDAAAQSDAQLREVLKNALASHDDDVAAFGLLETGKMGPPGADILYDLAYGGPRDSGSQRARKALNHPDVIKHASAPLQVAIELRNAKDCGDKKQLLDKAAAQGDARTLALLESYVQAGGCGFLGTRDCWSCMHKDGSLASATQKLRARIAP